MQDESKYFEAFFDQLLSDLESKVSFPLEKASLLTLSRDLIEENLSLASDAASVGHIETCCSVIAIFRYLRSEMSMNDCLEAIRYGFVNSLSFITHQTEKFLSQSPDPFNDMIAMSKQKEKEYGDSFEFYRKKDDGLAYLLEVKKCFFCKLLTVNNAQELMPIFCDFDTLWMKAIDPKKHGFKFDRPETIGTGGDVCKFYFNKVLN